MPPQAANLTFSCCVDIPREGQFSSSGGSAGAGLPERGEGARSYEVSTGMAPVFGGPLAIREFLGFEDQKGL